MFPKLKYLNLENNKIKMIDFKEFSDPLSFPSLKVLDLAFNGLTSLPEQSLNPLNLSTALMTERETRLNLDVNYNDFTCDAVRNQL